MRCRRRSPGPNGIAAKRAGCEARRASVSMCCRSIGQRGRTRHAPARFTDQFPHESSSKTVSRAHELAASLRDDYDRRILGDRPRTPRQRPCSNAMSASAPPAAAVRVVQEADDVGKTPNQSSRAQRTILFFAGTPAPGCSWSCLPGTEKRGTGAAATGIAAPATELNIGNCQQERREKREH